MDTDFKCRKQVSYDQMNGLLEFMQEHQDLAKGLTRGRRGKHHSLKLWNLCAKKLNVIKDGATKQGKGWSKYWCDWKYRVRRKALELKAAKDNNLPPPEGIVPLTHMEDCILGMIGENAVDGVIIKSDPLANGDTEEEGPDNRDTNIPVDTTPSIDPYLGTRQSARNRKRRNSSRDLSELEHSGPSSPPERKPRRAPHVGANESDPDEDASEFLRLEKEKLVTSKRIQEGVQSIATEISRLTDVMTHIRDLLVNNRINIYLQSFTMYLHSVKSILSTSLVENIEVEKAKEVSGL